MSRKVTVYKAAMPAPKVASQYLVQIPYLGIKTSLLIEQATYPTEEVGEVVVWNKGQPIYFPTLMKVPGTFTCTIPEDAFARNQISIDALRNIQIGNGNYTIMFDIYIAMTFGQSVIALPNTGRLLASAFLLSVDQITFDASKPDEVLKWKLTFRYNYIKHLNKFPY